MSGISGIYRSEKYLVVERNRHQFPLHCTWCNRVIKASAATAAGRKETERPPACDSCAAARSQLPKLAAALGVIALLATPIAYVTLGPLIAAAALFMALADLGLAWWLHSAARSVQIVREDQQYVWIAGAHPDFLAMLPAWHGMKLEEMQNRNA